ncbi:hypothetical protein LY76DRAFT_100150 [Colletotrichum caudatum]|nr:hypothetical protein LY76DRAFT_100150 [Colletotrichum caudatum]
MREVGTSCACPSIGHTLAELLLLQEQLSRFREMHILQNPCRRRTPGGTCHLSQLRPNDGSGRTLPHGTLPRQPVMKTAESPMCRGRLRSTSIPFESPCIPHFVPTHEGLLVY